MAIFAGLLSAGLIKGSGNATSGANALSDWFAENPAQAALRCLLVPALETLFWQVLFIDGAARLRLPRWIPIVLPALAFAVTLHWERGVLTMASAFWFWWVLGMVYSSQRPTSFLRAFALTTAVHWTPLLFMLLGPWLAPAPPPFP